MRDKKYFDDRIYVFTNKELKDKTQEHIEDDKPLYLFIDEAIREKLEREGVTVDKKPRVPVLQ